GSGGVGGGDGGGAGVCVTVGALRTELVKRIASSPTGIKAAATLLKQELKGVGIPQLRTLVNRVARNFGPTKTDPNGDQAKRLLGWIAQARTKMATNLTEAELKSFARALKALGSKARRPFTRLGQEFNF